MSLFSFYFLRLDSPNKPGFLIVECSRSHSDTPRLVGFPWTRDQPIAQTSTPRLVGLPWTRDQPVAQTSTWQHTTLTRNKHPCLSGIRTHNPSKRAVADLRPSLRCHWD